MIVIASEANRFPLNELTMTETMPISVDMVRMMVGDLHMGSDTNSGEVVWQGKIFERTDCGMEYPATSFDIRVEDGRATVTMEGFSGPGLMSQWIYEANQRDYIVQTPVRQPRGPMRAC